ncbi:Microbial Terpene synthase-like protein [Trichinella spiralis]|uniref:Microbial Terpene synthase-like protein n=1 Tax=Trichinella spiralis TaxID=6334 RepID=A0ABR3K2B3_TRISP
MLRILSPLKQRNTESTRQTPFHPLLKHFRGHNVQVLGAAFLTVEYGFFNRPLHALVVKGRRYSLLGRNWFEPLDIRLHPRYREGTTSGTPYWRISTLIQRAPDECHWHSEPLNHGRIEWLVTKPLIYYEPAPHEMDQDNRLSLWLSVMSKTVTD